MTTEAPAPLPILLAEELNDLRAAVLAGKEFSIEEYSQIIRSYHAHRLGSAAAMAPKVTARTERTAAAAPIDLATIISKLKSGG